MEKQKKDEQDAVDNLKAATDNMIEGGKILKEKIEEKKATMQKIVDKVDPKFYQQAQNVAIKAKKIVADMQNKSITPKQGIALLEALKI